MAWDWGQNRSLHFILCVFLCEATKGASDWQNYRLTRKSNNIKKTHSRLSHMIKRESLMFSLRQFCLDFPIFTMIDSKFHFSPTFTSNIFFWTRNKNDVCLKHMTSSTLVKCNSMIISVVMPSYTLLCFFATLVNTELHNPKNHVSHLSIHEFAHRALWFFWGITLRQRQYPFFLN